jgi:hypothetical protein
MFKEYLAKDLDWLYAFQGLLALITLWLKTTKKDKDFKVG